MLAFKEYTTTLLATNFCFFFFLIFIYLFYVREYTVAVQMVMSLHVVVEN